MIKVSNSKAKITAAKKTITVSDVLIENGQFVDEDGNIVDKVHEEIPEDIQNFTIKISFELPDEE